MTKIPQEHFDFSVHSSTIRDYFMEETDSSNDSFNNSTLDYFTLSDIKNNELYLLFNKNMILNNETQNREVIKKIMFKIIVKRGKKGEKFNQKYPKEHSARSRDNIISKIQSHFMNFVVSLLNDCILKFFKKKKFNFKKFNYKEKANSSHDHFENLKNYNINQLIESMKISNKYKKCSKDINIKHLMKLRNHPWFSSFLKMKYLDLFNIYYNDQQPFNEILLFGETIKLSKKTKPFYLLLIMNNKLKEEIIEVVEDEYINDVNNSKYRQI